MINYIWKVNRMVVKNDSELSNVIINIYWEKIGVDEDGDTGAFYGNMTLPAPDTTMFVEFNQLTENQVIEWVKSIMDPDYEINVNKFIQREIKRKKQIITEISPEELPWNVNNIQ